MSNAATPTTDQPLTEAEARAELLALTDFDMSRLTAFLVGYDPELAVRVAVVARRFWGIVGEPDGR